MDHKLSMTYITCWISLLKDADEKGQLSVVEAVTGIAGGVEELRKIMNSTEELSIMDRGMLGLHLNT